MTNPDERERNFHLADEYIIKHPSLHAEDSQWKINSIIPLVDRCISCINKDDINLLDVGGGSGIILKEVSEYIQESHGVKVNRFALDLSLDILNIQKKQNPELRKALAEDICMTSLGNKEIDLTLMIDVLEHVSDPKSALEEIKRFSNFAIFKVPLEDNLYLRFYNFVKRGKPRQRSIENLGHINIYNLKKLNRHIEKHTGKILSFHFANASSYYLCEEYYRNQMRQTEKLIYILASHIYRISSRLSSLIFTDFVLILVQCY